MPRWAACLIGAIICVLIAMLLAPLIPDVGAILAVVAWIGAVVLGIAAVFYLVTGRGSSV